MENKIPDLEKLSDEELCTLSHSGNSEAEECLVKRYMRTVRMCSRPYFLAGGDVEDLLQEGVMGLVKAIREYRADKGSAFKSYAELCIKRKLYSAIKSALREKHALLNNSLSYNALFFEDENAVVLESAGLTPEETLIGQEQADELTAALNGKLSAFEAEVLKEYLNGTSSSEIAEKLDKSPKSIENAVQRVRRKAALHLKSALTDKI